MSWSSLLSFLPKVLDFVIGSYKQKRDPGRAILRKNDFYQPLIDEFESYNKEENIHFIHFDFPLLNEIVKHSYKYVPSKEIKQKCFSINTRITEFKTIDSVYIAETIIVDIFTQGYEKLYGSKIDGITYLTDIEGMEYEYENLVKPVELIQRREFKKSVENLLHNEGSEDVSVYISPNNYEVAYSDLIFIYFSYLNANINGERIVLPQLKEDIQMGPAEYIAVTWDFFKELNNDFQIMRKYALLHEINIEIVDLLMLLKKRVAKIVKTHEV